MRIAGQAKPRVSRRQIFTILLFLLGVRWWLSFPFDQMPGSIEWAGIAVGICLGLNPFLNRKASAAAFRVERWMGKWRYAAAIAVGIAVCAYLLSEVSANSGEMFLRIHDEHSYLIQAQMLARGKLWSATYPPRIAPFFDTFHIIVDRVYSSIYFPGAAMTMVPAVWLGLPYWTSPLVCGAAAAGMFFLVVREMFGSLRALIAVLMLVSLQYFRWMSLMLMSETAFLLLILTMVWAWTKWRKHPSIGWAILMGAAAGWGAITRPLDEACYAVVLCSAILWEWRGEPMVIGKTVLAAGLAMLPFLGVQLAQNIGVTGKWYETAMQYYEHVSYPGPLMGFAGADMNNLPPGTSAPKRELAEYWMGLYSDHTLKNTLKSWYSVRFRQTEVDTLPDSILLVLFPLALAARWNVARVIFPATAVLLRAVYMCYVFPFDQYLVPVMPAMICLVLMGWEGLARGWPRYRRYISGFGAPLLVGISLGTMPEFHHGRDMLPNFCEPEKQINRDLSQLREPSVVLFPFTEREEEVLWFPVYNDSVAWPDDALVVRANDLGEDQNWKLYRYYAQIQPQRKFYIYEPTGAGELHNLKYIGTAGQLAARHAGG
jgi:hypothetical protein